MSLQFKNELSLIINERVNEIIKEEISKTVYCEKKHLEYIQMIFRIRYLYEYVEEIEDIKRQSFINIVLNKTINNYDDDEINKHLLIFNDNAYVKHHKIIRLFFLEGESLYPLFNHTIQIPLENFKHTGKIITCPITMEDIKEGDNMVKIVKCNHSFSETGILSWLVIKQNCPICRGGCIL